MRESFVFHSEYIADLPDEYKGMFAIYTINYALNDESPKIADGTLEQALWIKIARRIDQEREKYEAIKVKRATAGKKHKGNQYKKEASKQKEIKAHPKKEKREAIEKPSKRQKVTTFEKPTIEEIKAYCAERKNNVDATSFFDFYESKGWKVGTVKMKDWKASVRTWEQRQKNEGVQQNGTGALWGNENSVPDEIMNMM
jgi:hypothetical protein|nr:MAG TPA: hypothetical protein [Caudoviricetes sp.]